MCFGLCFELSFKLCFNLSFILCFNRCFDLCFNFMFQFMFQFMCYEWQPGQPREDSPGPRQKGRRTLGPQTERWGDRNSRKQHLKGQPRWTKVDSPGTSGGHSRRENSSRGHGKRGEQESSRSQDEMAEWWDRRQSSIYKVFTHRVDFL